MKIRYSVVLAALVIPAQLCSLEQYTFRPSIDPDSGAVSEIKVYRGAGAQLVQNLDECEVDEKPPKGEQAIKTEDLNFDGHPDVLLLSSWGATGNQSYCVWVFDPASGRFQYVPDFLLGAHLLDRKSKTVLTWSNGGAAGGIYQRSTLQFLDNRPIVLSEERRDWDPGKNAYKVEIFTRENGRLVLKRRAWDAKLPPTVEFHIRAEKPQYQVDEPVVLLLEIVNRGETAARFPAGCCTYEIKVAGPGIPERDASQTPELVVCACPNAILTLPAGETYPERIPLGDHYELKLPGSYRIQVTRQVGFSGEEWLHAETVIQLVLSPSRRGKQ
jgi:hypothetical protein